MRCPPPSHTTTARLLVVVLLLSLAAGVAGCADDDGTADDGRPRVVVSTAVLGALVRELVGCRARVDVLMPNGVDPHDFQPSARDARRLLTADLVVVNGAGLEQGLDEALAQAREEGVPVVAAADRVRLRRPDPGADEAGADPHIWLDPVRMGRVVQALVGPLRRDAGVDVAVPATRLRARLAALTRSLADQAATVPADRRSLVTGHESMGYFADRFGFRIAGAIVPSLGSQAEPSARRLADLVRLVRARRVPAVFTEIGTAPSIATALAEDAGVKVVEVPTHTLPDDGSYDTLMHDVMDRVAGALGGRG